MATGPEHYQQAEKHLRDAGMADPEEPRDMGLLAAAQVHATLALAAATALPTAGELPIADHDAWWAAAGSEPIHREPAP